MAAMEVSGISTTAKLPHQSDGTDGSGTSTAPRTRRASRYQRGLTCANCRSRKVRCGGGFPTCKTCEIYNDECRYDKPPPMAKVMAMAQRLKEAEEKIARLQEQSRASYSTEESSNNRDSVSPGTAAAESTAEATNMDFTDQTQPETTPPPNISLENTPPSFTSAQKSTNGPPPLLGRPDGFSPNLTLDENGEVQYYGPTSAVHDPSLLQFPSDPAHNTSAACESSSKVEIVSYAEESKMWEEFAIGNASLQTGIPRQILAKILHMHWTWVSPMFMYVYRPAFIHDMATGGRYYSEFLLTVICAHAAKYEDGNCADFLLSRVRQLLGTAIQQPSSIPTVQALLQLSARELANGSISQAWVYSGIAFRMASDLGLQHSGPNFEGHGAVDQEIRRRLFWSCYFWDKATSLYAGRLPAITESLDHDTLDRLDDSMDAEPWSPYYGDSLNLTKPNQNWYPPKCSYVVSCFANSCKLAIIINDIIVHLYSRKSRTVTEEALRDIEKRLEMWRTQSPAHLRYNPDSLPTICPPQHIISQNLLYYTSIILAHRPFWSVSTYYEICITAAQAIERLVLLLESTFGLENITYLMGYCIYTGASAVLEEAKSSNQGIDHPILRNFLRALNAGMRRCPLLEKSLKIIIKSLNRATQDQTNTPLDGAGSHQASSQASTTTHNWTTNSYIPAFPYLDSALTIDFNKNTYFSHSDIDSMALLDCFPEMRVNTGDSFGQFS